jgi:hypothetical protein
VIPSGSLFGVASAYSVMIPVALMRPILLAVASVNHIAPSGPLVMPVGPLFPVEIANSVIVCAIAVGATASSTAAIAPPSSGVKDRGDLAIIPL